MLISFHFSLTFASCTSFEMVLQSFSSFRSELPSPLSPTTPGGIFGMPSGGGNVFNSTMASSRSSSPAARDETDSLVATIRQLTEEKDEMASKMDSLVQQLEQVDGLVVLIETLRNRGYFSFL